MKRWRSLSAAIGLLMTIPATQADDAPACIEVTVGGYKTPDYECLSRQMGNDPQAAAAAQHLQDELNVPTSKRPPNTVGLATPAATSVRMGNTFGTSVKPQRPPVSVGGTPLLK